jgi:hypothetical protein
MFGTAMSYKWIQTEQLENLGHATQWIKTDHGRVDTMISFEVFMLCLRILIH